MLNGTPTLDVPRNEPVRGYGPGSPEKAALNGQGALAGPLVCGSRQRYM